mmetsp:Transcript_13152/g.21464  ORF Transcript_13152/g.21464 Transcript_13152/m.21464 type:complete len:95 (+) Transcript_13152:3333-3617(+)
MFLTDIFTAEVLLSPLYSCSRSSRSCSSGSSSPPLLLCLFKLRPVNLTRDPLSEEQALRPGTHRLRSRDLCEDKTTFALSTEQKGGKQTNKKDH